MHRLAPAGLVPALLVASVEAQTSHVVSEAEFLSVLDAAHPAVAERSQDVALARAGLVAASTLENPVLGVVREDPSGPIRQTDWTLSWQPPGSGRRFEIAERRQAVEAAEARRIEDLRRLRLQMREVYADWAVASAQRGRLAAHAARVASLAARESERVERGESSGLEARRLGLTAAVLRARLSLAEAAAEAARERARAWHPELARDAEPLLPPLPPPPALAQDHPRLQAAQSDLDAAHLARQAAGRFVRSPVLSLGWQRQEIGPEAPEGPTLGLAWPLPLFGRSQAERAMAEARVSLARARLETARREISAARSAAVATYRRLVAARAEAEAALDGNDRMLAGAEASFRLGEASLSDLLETLRSVTEAEMARLDLHRAALTAHRELERLTGAPDPPVSPTEPNPEETSP